MVYRLPELFWFSCSLIFRLRQSHPMDINFYHSGSVIYLKLPSFWWLSVIRASYERPPHTSLQRGHGHGISQSFRIHHRKSGDDRLGYLQSQRFYKKLFHEGKCMNRAWSSPPEAMVCLAVDIFPGNDAKSPRLHLSILAKESNIGIKTIAGWSITKCVAKIHPI